MHSILVDIRSQNNDLTPIVVLAPTQRCGTTLLQRAINAGNEAVIVGENFYMMEKYARNIATCFQMEIEKRKIVEATKQEFLAGNKGIDGSALFLDYEPYLHKIAGDFYSLVRHYKDSAEKHGFKAWGIKHQTRDAGATLGFLNLVPNARVVFLTRHVFDTAASFRGRWPKMIETPKQIMEFGRTWNSGMVIKEKIRNPMLFCKYEDMIANPQRFCDDVEKFLGIKLGREQFDIKVNSHVQSGNREEVKKGSEYIKPASLTEEELGLLRQQTSAMLTAHQYSAAAAA